jgi:ubiquinone/menaquinone biosynthesis C-methylase UbiE
VNPPAPVRARGLEAKLRPFPDSTPVGLVRLIGGPGPAAEQARLLARVGLLGSGSAGEPSGELCRLARRFVEPIEHAAELRPVAEGDAWTGVVALSRPKKDPRPSDVPAGWGGRPSGPEPRVVVARRRTARGGTDGSCVVLSFEREDARAWGTEPPFLDGSPAGSPRLPAMEEPRQIARMQCVYGDEDEELRALLDESLAPRPPDFLLDLAVALLRADSRVLDVGCRDARHLITLVARSGCTGVGIDPIDRNLERARAAVTTADLDQRIEIRRGVMEQIEEADSSVDVVWCRDVLEIIPDLRAGLSEVGRVLKPGGAAVIYTVFATQRLEPREATALNQPLGNVPQNLDRAWVEEAFKQACFRVERLEEIGAEFREYDEERTQPISKSLLRLARLRRRREEVIRRFGRDKYEVWEASLHWLAYLLLGKMDPVAYVLRLP